MVGYHERLLDGAAPAEALAAAVAAARLGHRAARAVQLLRCRALTRRKHNRLPKMPGAVAVLDTSMRHAIGASPRPQPSQPAAHAARTPIPIQGLIARLCRSTVD